MLPQWQLSAFNKDNSSLWPAVLFWIMALIFPLICGCWSLWMKVNLSSTKEDRGSSKKPFVKKEHFQLDWETLFSWYKCDLKKNVILFSSLRTNSRTVCLWNTSLHSYFPCYSKENTSQTLHFSSYCIYWIVRLSVKNLHFLFCLWSGFFLECIFTGVCTCLRYYLPIFMVYFWKRSGTLPLRYAFVPSMAINRRG